MSLMVSVVITPESWPESATTELLGNLIEALEGVSSEVIASVSDSASVALENELLDAGCRIIATPGDSPSALVNRAVAAAESDLVLILDEDFILPRGGVGAALRHLESAECEVAMLERRESGEQWEAAEGVLRAAMEGDYLDSAPRGTTNTGLAMLCSRRAFLHVRGLDERPGMQPDASADLVIRMARAGMPIEWLQGPNVSAYHLSSWCTRETHRLELDKTRKNREEAIAGDASIYRNLRTWSVPRELRPVLVTVTISTRDRCEYLADSLNSVLAQTFQDFELIVVDDGSTDETQAVVERFTDPRVRYLRQEPAGISAARNRAADLSQGHFTAVHDDDDIMTETRR